MFALRPEGVTPLTLRARPGALRLLGPRRPDPGPVRMELST